MKPRQITAIFLIVIALILLWIALDPMGSQILRMLAHRATSDGPYAQRDWSESGGQGESKISVFIFRDRNRNGQYDPLDLPMASVGVQVQRPDRTERMRSSNINGYANFSMDYHGTESDISQVDQPHAFRVLIPPDFEVTTNNVGQQTTFRHLPGAISDIIANDPPTVIGLAPKLTVTGRVDIPPIAPSTTRLTVVKPDGTSFDVTTDNKGVFEFEAMPGEWAIITKNDEEGEVNKRKFKVLDVPVRLSKITIGLSLLEKDTAKVTEDFEYLHRADIDKIPNGHAGLNWNYLLAIDNQLYRGPGYVNTLTSGRAVAYNSSGHPVTISGMPDEQFDFLGAYFGVAWPAAEGESLVVEAWRGAELVGREVLKLSHLGPVWFEADYRGIDKLTLSTEHYWQFVMDDMLFRR